MPYLCRIFFTMVKHFITYFFSLVLLISVATPSYMSLIEETSKVEVVDINPTRIAQWNDENLDNLPVYEPGLADLIAETRGRNLFFSTDVDRAIQEADMIFIPDFNDKIGKKLILNNRDKFISLMLIFGQLKLLQVILKRLQIELNELEKFEDNYFN